MKIRGAYQDYICLDIRSVFKQQPMDLVACPMCLSQLKKIEVLTSACGNEHLASSFLPYIDFTHLYTCPQCSWWAVRELGGDYEFHDGIFDYLIIGILKKWDLKSLETEVSTLRTYFTQRERAAHFRRLDALTLSDMMSNILGDEGRTCNVHHFGTCREDDERTDIYLIENEVKWLVEVNYYYGEERLSVEPLGVLNGVLISEERLYGAIVTNEARAFGSPRTYFINLVDSDLLLKMLGMIPRVHARPWANALDEKVSWAKPEKMSKEFASLIFLETLDSL